MADFFIIKTLPTRANLLFDGIPVVVNQKYPVAEESKFTAQNISGYRSEPLDSFTYKAEVNGVISQNTSTVQLNFTTTAGTPSVQNIVKTIELNTQINFSDGVVYENNFDRIIVTEIIGKGSWTLGSDPVIVGQEVFAYSFFQNMKFTSNQSGAKSNYNVLKFKFAKLDFVFPIENTFIINTTSLVELNSDLYVLNVEDDLYFIKTMSFNVDEYLVGSVVDISYTINKASIFVDPEDVLTIKNEIKNTSINVNSNGTYNSDYSSETGTNKITLTIKLVNDFVPGDNIKIELMSMDSDPLLVNPIKKEITFNLE